jgi:hypothetical protein
VGDGAQAIRLTDEQRIDWLRFIRSQNVGPRGIMAARMPRSKRCRGWRAAAAAAHPKSVHARTPSAK